MRMIKVERGNREELPHVSCKKLRLGMRRTKEMVRLWKLNLGVEAPTPRGEVRRARRGIGRGELAQETPWDSGKNKD